MLGQSFHLINLVLKLGNCGFCERVILLHFRNQLFSSGEFFNDLCLLFIDRSNCQVNLRVNSFLQRLPEVLCERGSKRLKAFH